MASSTASKHEPSSSASPTPTPTSTDATPSNDHRMVPVIIILVILAVFLIAYIIFITMRLKRRQDRGELEAGPYQGTALNHDHPAANITPFGATGPNGGKRGPEFNHNPGRDMRIAVRRPDGAWHFTDSRTPFTPTGVNDIDVTPSPVSSTANFFQSYAPSVPSRAYRTPYIPNEPPHTPTYYREPCRDHFDDRQS